MKVLMLLLTRSGAHMKSHSKTLHVAVFNGKFCQIEISERSSVTLFDLGQQVRILVDSRKKHTLCCHHLLSNQTAIGLPMLAHEVFETR